MSTIEITTKIEALKELEALIEEAKAEAEALRDIIKNEMLEQGTEELEVGLCNSYLTNKIKFTVLEKNKKIRTCYLRTVNQVLEK